MILFQYLQTMAPLSKSRSKRAGQKRLESNNAITHSLNDAAENQTG